MWTHVVPLLTGHHDVIAPMALGHHGGHPSTTRPVRIADVTDDVERLLDELSLSPAHLALSTGAPRPSYRGAVTADADPRVDDYIDSLPDWQQAICHQVRALVHAADPDVTETIKRTDRPYFVLEGNVCALLAARDHVNVFLYDGGIVPDPEGIITSGHENKTARTVAIRQGDAINADALTAMFRAIIANNRAGGWRRLKHEA